MQGLLEYAVFTVHTLLDWLPRLSSLRHAVGGIRQYLFHKNDTPKQAAIGRATLSVCEQQQQQAVNAQWLASLIETPVRTRLLRKIYKGGWHELREPFKNYVCHLGLVRNKSGQKYNKFLMCHSISRFIEAASHMC